MNKRAYTAPQISCVCVEALVPLCDSYGVYDKQSTATALSGRRSNGTSYYEEDEEEDCSYGGLW